MHIINAGGSSYPTAWNGYKTAASYDKQHWFRVDTSYDSSKGVLTVQHTPQHNYVRYAYFAPYSLEQHYSLIMQMQLKHNVQLHLLGKTLDGRDLHMLQVSPHLPDRYLATSHVATVMQSTALARLWLVPEVVCYV
eukprot:GHRR01020514.1.p1 GENE.GHRR01020514.1~~GHRR01020514.1.p1  ORF type:complete len:136 (+),score=47.50 GHRR01020514.1:1215-1622(+)